MSGLAFQHIIPDVVPKDSKALNAVEKGSDNALYRPTRFPGWKQAMLWIQMASIPNFDNLRDGIVMRSCHGSQTPE